MDLVNADSERPYGLRIVYEYTDMKCNDPYQFCWDGLLAFGKSSQ